MTTFMKNTYNTMVTSVDGLKRSLGGESMYGLPFATYTQLILIT